MQGAATAQECKEGEKKRKNEEERTTSREMNRGIGNLDDSGGWLEARQGGAEIQLTKKDGATG